MSKPIQITPEYFIQKWHGSMLTERQASHQHFLNLCALIGEPEPADVDPKGDWFTFDRGAKKSDGSDGFADVWKKGCFAWEYKGKHKDMPAALKQVQQYALALDNPPLLITCDFDTIQITTNFTNTVTKTTVIPIASMSEPATLQLLRDVFREPERLKPGETRQQMTEGAAKLFGDLASRLRKRAPDGLDAVQLAHFLNKLLFCLFAQNVELLPRNVVTRMAENLYRAFKPLQFSQGLHDLFQRMAEGGMYGGDEIARFNGGLFEDGPIVHLDNDEVKLVRDIARLDWSQIDPAIFGTLFERGLDPAKRSQLGAHYTNPESIQRIVRPVVVEPLERDWVATLADIDALLAEIETLTPKQQRAKRDAATLQFEGYLKRLALTRVLDPACGSGNFLYLSLRALHELQHKAVIDAKLRGLSSGLNPQLEGVGPRNVLGIELNPYAAELARLTVWIGEIQWLRDRGLRIEQNPVLQTLETIQCHDALLNEDGTEFEWPTATCIVGNPPFIGDKKMRSELGDQYVATVREAYAGRVPGGADFVCFWFDKARAQIVAGKTMRAGLVSTDSIRGGKNRVVLDRILVDGLHIFDAWDKLVWWDKNVMVDVSMISFAEATATPVVRLNGLATDLIRADLTTSSQADLTTVQELGENARFSLQGAITGPHLEVPGSLARSWLKDPNPDGRSNAQVLRPTLNTNDVVKRPADTWVIDFPTTATEAEVALWTLPFTHAHAGHLKRVIRNKEAKSESQWWLMHRPRPVLRAAVAGLQRFIVSTRVSKFRVLVWCDVRVMPNSAVVVIPREDDTTFGILHSRIQELWSARLGSALQDRPRFTPTTTFETFPFPAGLEPNRPARDYAEDPRARTIAAAAKGLVKLRDEWLNPTAWIDYIPEVVPGYPDRMVAKPGHEAELKERTLTKLYNQRPQWLANAHKALDEAVMAAYGWPTGLGDEEILGKLLTLNQERAGAKVEAPTSADPDEAE